MAYAAWRKALDAKLRLIRYFENGEFLRVHALVGLDKSEHIRALCNYYSTIIREVEPLWIASNIGRGIVKNLCDKNTVFDMGTAPIPDNGLIWFEEPLVQLTRSSEYKGERKVIIEGILYSVETDSQGKKHMVSCLWQRAPIGLVPVIVDVIQLGQTIEEWMATHVEILKRSGGSGIQLEERILSTETRYGFMLRYMYTMFSFMEQRIVVSPVQPVDRAARRQAERQNVHPDVRVVTWRLKKYEKMETEHHQIDWSCHWSSRAHERRLKDGRVIPIRGSIKGDLSKPYKPPTPNVHVVTRE